MKQSIKFISLCAIIFLFIILYPESLLIGTKNGLSLWYQQILPALFPICFLQAIVMASGVLDNIPGKLLPRVLFPVGLVFGMPMGAKLAVDAYQNGYLTKKQCKALCIATGNFSISFFLNYVFRIIPLDIPHQVLFLCCIYGIPASYGFFMLICYLQSPDPVQKNTAPRFRFDTKIFDAGIYDSFHILLKICGYLIFASVLVAFLQKIPGKWILTKGILCGLTEATNGINLLGILPYPQFLKPVIAIIFLSFTGLSGVIQVCSLFSKTDLSPISYLSSKIIVAIVTAICYQVLALFVSPLW